MPAPVISLNSFTIAAVIEANQGEETVTAELEQAAEGAEASDIEEVADAE